MEMEAPSSGPSTTAVALDDTVDMSFASAASAEVIQAALVQEILTEDAPKGAQPLPTASLDDDLLR